jgi:hypothetical protein
VVLLCRFDWSETSENIGCGLICCTCVGGFGLSQVLRRPRLSSQSVQLFLGRNWNVFWLPMATAAIPADRIRVTRPVAMALCAPTRPYGMLQR